MEPRKKWATRTLLLVAIISVAIVAGSSWLLRNERTPNWKASADVLQGPSHGGGASGQGLAAAPQEGDPSTYTRRQIRRITDDNGVPIRDVHIRWTALRCIGDKPNIEGGWTVETVSDNDGSWAFDEVPPAWAQCFTLAFLHEEYVGHVVSTSVPLEHVEELQHIVLRQSPSRRARVLDFEGYPVEGATVHHELYPSTVDGCSVGVGTCRPVTMTYVTDATGAVVLNPLAGPNRIWAEADELVSCRWEGLLRRDVTLILAPKFSARGEVSAAANIEMPQRLHVRCSIENGSGETILGSAKVNGDGKWEFGDIPLLSAGRYSFWIDGNNVVRSQVSIDAPSAGSVCTIALELRLGVSLPIVVEDTEGNPLREAVVMARWMHEGVWISKSRSTDVAGATLMDGMPSSVIYLSASKAGFIDGALDPLSVSDARSDPILISLAPGATLHGRCMRDGQPVETFELVWWTDPLVRKSRELFDAATEGAFQVSRMPLGEVTVLATAGLLGQSESVTLNLEPNKATFVELELLAVAKGRGEVVDASTMTPLPYPLIQIYTNSRGRRIEKRGVEVVGTADGRFVIDGLTCGVNLISVEADGYAPRSVLGVWKQGALVEFGIVPLKRRLPVEIQLIGAENANWSSYVCEIAGEQSIADRRFPSSGLLKYDDLNVGGHAARIIYPGQKTYKDIAFRIGPWWSRRVEVPVHAQVMEVSVAPPVGHTIPIDHLIIVQSGLGSERSSRQYYALPANGRAQVEWAPGPLVVTVENWSGAIVGMKAVQGAAPSSLIEIELGQASQRLVRIIDRDGVPLTAVTVLVSDPNAHTGWYENQLSDDSGLCRFGSIELEEVLVLMHRYPEGVMAGQRVNLPAQGEVLDLVFNPDWELSVAVMERTTELTGIELVAMDPDARRVLPRAVSDSSGVASMGRVSGNDWKVRIDHPGLWPTEVIVDAQDPKPFRIQARRTGSLHLTLLRNGLAIPNIAIELMYLDTGEMVQQWISAGRLSPESSLVSSASGVIQLDGIPNGAYAWRVVDDNGGLTEGAIAVPVQARASELINVP